MGGGGGHGDIYNGGSGGIQISAVQPTSQPVRFERCARQRRSLTVPQAPRFKPTMAPWHLCSVRWYLACKLLLENHTVRMHNLWPCLPDRTRGGAAELKPSCVHVCSLLVRSGHFGHRLCYRVQQLTPRPPPRHRHSEQCRCCRCRPLSHSQNAVIVEVGVAASRRPANAAPARGANALTPPRPRRVSAEKTPSRRVGAATLRGGGSQKLGAKE